jgi:hypothetical protein
MKWGKAYRISAEWGRSLFLLNGLQLSIDLL